MKIKKSSIFVTAFAFAFLFLSFHAWAVVNWTKDTANNPVYEPGDGVENWDADDVFAPMVIKEGPDSYTMWYVGDLGIGRATSTDGVNWGSGTSVFWPSGSGWDGNIVDYCWVIKGASGASLYQMWYMGTDFTGSKIGYATSDDGITWNRSASNPVLYGSGVSDWDGSDVTAPTVIYDSSAVTPYKMWYAGGSGVKIEGIGYAESQDGVAWHKYDNPNTTEDPYAHSDPVIFTGNEGAWDGDWLGSPTVIKDGATYRMWYHGGGVIILQSGMPIP